MILTNSFAHLFCTSEMKRSLNLSLNPCFHTMDLILYQHNSLYAIDDGLLYADCKVGLLHWLITKIEK